MAATLVLIAAGCGGEEDSPAPAGADREPPERPERAESPLLGGGERLLFFGDSLSIEGEPSFAELLPAELESAAPETSVENVSVPGSTSADWRPGSELFERELAPRLERADVVLVTVGGNDLEAALGGADGIDALERAEGAAAAQDLGGALDRIGANLTRSFAAIRKSSPSTRIVYVGYPDYSQSAAWRAAAGPLGAVGLRLGLGALLDTVRSAGPDRTVDLLAATRRAGVDALLADGEHLSAAGHRLYAAELAAALTR